MTVYRRLPVIVAQMALLSGCAFRPQVTHMAVEYNQFVADATNRQTLINILRARDREPLHFTTFTTIHGSADFTSAASLTTSLVGNTRTLAPVAGNKDRYLTTAKSTSADTITPAFTVSVSSGTSFDIGVNSTDEFWKGILKPISEETVAYYLDQGWSSDLLSRLFIERLDFSVIITDPVTKVAITYDRIASVTNSAEHAGPGARFHAFMACRPLRATTKIRERAILPVDAASDLNGVAKETLASLRAPDREQAASLDRTGRGTATRPESKSPVSPYLQLADAQKSVGLTLGTRCNAFGALIQTGFRDNVDANYKPLATTADAGTPVAYVAADDTPTTLAPPISTANLGSVGPAIPAAPTLRNDGACKPYVRRGYECDIETSIILRPIEGVIHYLGEYVREQEKADEETLEVASRTPERRTASLRDGAASSSMGQTPARRPFRWWLLNGEEPLIAITKRSDRITPKSYVTSFADVEYRGDHYYVPSSGLTLNGTAGRSSQVFALVQQLLNLNRSAKDLPTTPSVRIVN